MLNDIGLALRVHTSELRGVTCLGITQCYLPPDTGLTPVGKAGTRFAYPGGMEGWVDL